MQKWSSVKSRAEAALAFLDEGQGNFEGNWRECYALHAAQISSPIKAWANDKFVDSEQYAPMRDNFFVLAKNIVGKDKILFKHRIIVNPEILEKPEEIEKEVPVKNFGKDPDGKVIIQFSKKIQMIRNDISVKEACMSFPQRTEKHIKRYFRIKVRYEVPVTFFGFTFLMRKTEWLEGLKAHVFQHEVDHAMGKNIFHAK